MRLLALAVFLAPLAWAHAGDAPETVSAQEDGILVEVQPQAAVLKVNRTILVTGMAYPANDTRSPMRGVTFGLDVSGPGEASVQRYSPGHGFAAHVNFPVPGAWRLVVSVNGTPVPVPLHVYPNTPVRLESGVLHDAASRAGEPLNASLFFVEDPSGRPLRKEANATARIERWQDETKVHEEIVPLRPGAAAGEFVLRHAFPVEGAYRVRVASAEHGIGYDDLPPFRVSVAPAPPGETPDVRASPAAPLVGLLAALALAAVARKA